MQHWSDRYYTLLDSDNPQAWDLLSPNIRVQVGNQPASVGLDALMSGPLGRISNAKKSIRHEFLAVTPMSPDRAVIEAITHYVRHDGAAVSLPVVTVIGRDAAGLIEELRLFMDSTPLFEGMFARIRMQSDPVLVNRPEDRVKISREAIWSALVDKAHDATKYVPQITRCVVTDKGVDGDGRDWILREILVDGVEVEERIVFYPQSRIIFTRTRGDQMGVIHNILNEQDGELSLAFSMDLRWYGIPDGSDLARKIGDEMCKGYARTYAQVCANLRNRAAIAA